MDIIKLLTGKKRVFISEIVPILVQIYINAYKCDKNFKDDDLTINIVCSEISSRTKEALMENIKNNNIKAEYLCGDVDPYSFEQPKEIILDYPSKSYLPKTCYINLESLVEYLLTDKSVSDYIPDELLAVAGVKNPNGIKTATNVDHISDIHSNELVAYEDIISDETILKLMDLPLPKMKQQVAMLAAEKKKTDASIMAAAKIGLLFYEDGLQKPATEAKFLAEYKNQLDKLPSLPDTTIKRIYKNLPDGYRFSQSGGKMSTDQADITPIIKAAVYAGSIYDTDDVKTLDKLKSELELNDYDLPSDDVLNKIIVTVKDI
ncbi:MAG: hypothetical protein WCG87_12070 [Bacteroidota bacterium]